MGCPASSSDDHRSGEVGVDVGLAGSDELARAGYVAGNVLELRETLRPHQLFDHQLWRLAEAGTAANPEPRRFRLRRGSGRMRAQSQERSRPYPRRADSEMFSWSHARCAGSRAHPFSFFLMSFPLGNGEREGGALARLARDPDPAAVELHEFSGEG